MFVKKVSLMFVIGMIYCEEQNFQFNDTISQLPKELKDQVNEEQFKEVQSKVMPLFKEKCEQNGGPHAFSNAENAFTELTTCFNKLVDQEQIKKEIKEASPTGQVDEVFKKYCAKTPQFKGCVDALMTAVRPCLAPDEARNLNTVHNITDQLTEFICFKEGDRIALFIAEGGPECFQAQQEAIQQCLNNTVGEGRQFDPNNVTLDNIPKLEFRKEECNKLVELQNCVVAALDHCEQPTSANIVDSLFNFVRKATPCKDLLNSKPSGGVSARGPLVLLAAAAAAALLL